MQQKLEIQRREQDKEVSAHQQILLKIRAELQDMVQHNETKMAMVNSRMEDQITRSVLAIHSRLTRVSSGLRNVTLDPMSNWQQKLGHSSHKSKLNINPIETPR